MSNAPQTFLPGEMPAKPEPTVDEAERIRAAVREAGSQLAPLLSGKIRALMAEIHGPMTDMREQDPYAKDRLHQAWSVLRGVLVEADEWTSRINALQGGEHQEPADSISPGQPTAMRPVHIAPIPPTPEHAPFVPVITNPPPDRLS